MTLTVGPSAARAGTGARGAVASGFARSETSPIPLKQSQCANPGNRSGLDNHRAPNSDQVRYVPQLCIAVGAAVRIKSRAGSPIPVEPSASRGCTSRRADRVWRCAPDPLPASYGSCARGRGAAWIAPVEPEAPLRRLAVALRKRGALGGRSTRHLHPQHDLALGTSYHRSRPTGCAGHLMLHRRHWKWRRCGPQPLFIESGAAHDQRALRLLDLGQGPHEMPHCRSENALARRAQASSTRAR